MINERHEGTGTSPTRNLELSLLSLASNLENENPYGHEETHRSSERLTAQINVQTKLKMKHLCDEFCFHRQAQKMNVMHVPLNKNNQVEDVNDPMSRNDYVYFSRQTQVESAKQLKLRIALGSLQNTYVHRFASTLAILISDRFECATVIPEFQDDSKCCLNSFETFIFFS